jgi:hypothetical protein
MFRQQILVTTLQQLSSEWRQLTPLFYLSAGSLLIVGPSKAHTKELRQTDGERFFDFRSHFKFARDSRRLAGAFATVRTQNPTCETA